jgi:hypothetical protein
LWRQPEPGTGRDLSGKSHPPPPRTAQIFVPKICYGPAAISLRDIASASFYAKKLPCANSFGPLPELPPSHLKTAPKQQFSTFFHFFPRLFNQIPFFRGYKRVEKHNPLGLFSKPGRSFVTGSLFSRK